MAKKLSSSVSIGLIFSGCFVLTVMAATPRSTENTTRGIICISEAERTGLEGMKALNWEKRLPMVFVSLFASSPTTMPLPTENREPTTSPIMPAIVAVKRKSPIVLTPSFLSSAVLLSLKRPAMMLVGTKGMISMRKRSTYPLPTSAVHRRTSCDTEVSAKKKRDRPNRVPRINETKTRTENGIVKRFAITINDPRKSANTPSQRTTLIYFPLFEIL
ncbi:hypothetical protein SDC9_171336 [bioreactor metagenome]|uniref:Uncharacterized protein n=1 Tax=bioreactor metagenome TaxID=1076179 RepID=A0A645GJQ3_9ZZZZ